MKKINYGKVFLCVIFPVLVFVCCISFYKSIGAESKGNKVDDVVAYESVLVRKGDTLWSIAKENLDQPSDAEVRDYVNEIANINNISPTNIHAGNYVIVPRYSI